MLWLIPSHTMLFCGEMRRSSVWFLIACFWMIDVLITVVHGHGRQSWLQAVIAAAFLALWLMHRRREAKQAPRRPVR
jgi:Flp pilus assembly protein TadB